MIHMVAVLHVAHPARTGGDAGAPTGVVPTCCSHSRFNHDPTGALTMNTTMALTTIVAPEAVFQ